MFQKNAPFRSCISNIKITFIENPEDIDILMRMHSTLKYSHNYSITSGGLRDSYRNQIDEVDVNDYTSDGKSFEHKTK